MAVTTLRLPPKRNKSSIYLDDDVAEAIRSVASAEQRGLTPLVRDMLELYLKHAHPDWVEDDDAD